MNYEQLAKVLADATEASLNVFVRCQPEVLDFTDKEAVCELVVAASGGTEFTVQLNDETLPYVTTALALSIFGKGRKIISWNWKSLASFIQAKSGKPYVVDGAIIDLKVIESYAGKKGSPPKTVVEALNRLKALVSSGQWKEIEPAYKTVHLPLLTLVGPHLETVGVMDTAKANRVHAYYEIDGQDNGRLKCREAFRYAFVPHALTPEVRQALKPRRPDELFMQFDYRANEVFFLAWASKDPLLSELCKEPDVYISLYEHVVGGKCDDRDKAKKFFLPVIYGQSAPALSKRLKIAEGVAETIVSRIHELFPTALTWVGSFQKQAQETGKAKDIFGKVRHFPEGEHYLARNFSVQAPAALVCLEKLVQLHSSLKSITDLTYSVHDGYVVYALKDNWQRVYKAALEVLTGESCLCPGLRLRVACRAGRNLNDLKPLGAKKE